MAGQLIQACTGSSVPLRTVRRAKLDCTPRRRANGSGLAVQPLEVRRSDTTTRSRSLLSGHQVALMTSGLVQGSSNAAKVACSWR